MPEISIKAETLFYIGNFAVKNSLVLSSVVFTFFMILFVLYHRDTKKDNKSSLFYLINLILRNLYGLFHSITQDKVDVFFPLLSAFFLWILIQNWTGLLPGVGSITIKVPAAVVHGTIMHAKPAEEGKAKVNEIDNEARKDVPLETVSEENTHGVSEEKTTKAVVKEEAIHKEKEEEEMKDIPLFRGNNADLNATLALALISMTMVQVYGVRFLGLGGYLHKFINVSNPINFFLGFLEIMSEFSKVLSFAFRLFGNIFAGEVLMTIVAFLVPVLASFPFLILEIFVGFVQALVFSMLTSVFFSMAVAKH